ncbi:cell filamentation protein Fic [Bifidobacterium primatium]|uniref:protein adenylyltransferase n=1 Tax=Bifidobacterium primatium TaxID=2045438 RepID=A0A2M9H8T7_9BIFI|nr:Fic family protein [Bifidobacterium primatium]PJM73222.1 cell filamentation protein Fic [Bifidobacterium primatium]
MIELPDAIDPYLIPGTGVLRNLVGAKTVEDLEAAENDLVSVRALELRANPPKASGTLEQLQWIHHQLFQDVYDWAGQIRTVDIAKGDGQVFQPLAVFDMGVRYSEQVLREDHLLRHMDRATFINRLSANYDNFNILHPFREGNGRTQRMFWDLIAHDAGWRLDWSAVSKQENDKASQIARDSANESSLVVMFSKIVCTPDEYESRSTKNITAHLQDAGYTTVPNIYRPLTRSETEEELKRNIYRRMTD